MQNNEMRATQISSLTNMCKESCAIDRELYVKYDVKRGLRDLNGKGVLAGLTDISDIRTTKIVNGQEEHIDGELYYRGIKIDDLISGFMKDGRYGFEEITYLLITGKLPTMNELKEFQGLLASFYTLPKNFIRDVIMKAPSTDIMNTLTRSVLSLFPYDSNPNDTSLENVMRQCLLLIAVIPVFSVYSYAANGFYNNGDSLIIHRPKEEYSTAQNFLHMLRPDCKFSETEARVLDMALVLHAEHGGGNNSSFTTHVVTSSGTDTYAAIAAALGSLKGPKHGGANIKVVQMFEDMKASINIENDDEIIKYLEALLEGKAFDKAGLIYGMGHAVYSLSDPRARIFRDAVAKLAEEKGMTKEFSFYEKVEKYAPEIITRKRRIYKGVSANIDFYSGLAYSMLDIPTELYTPLFATARISGWSAHRMEELVNAGKIIRPGYKSVSTEKKYVPISERQY